MCFLSWTDALLLPEITETKSLPEEITAGLVILEAQCHNTPTTLCHRGALNCLRLGR